MRIMQVKKTLCGGLPMSCFQTSPRRANQHIEHNNLQKYEIGWKNMTIIDDFM